MEAFLYILKSTLVLSMFYGVYTLLLHRDTLFTFHRHFLIAGIVSALLLPLWEFTQTIVVEVSALSTPQQVLLEPINTSSSSVAANIGTAAIPWNMIIGTLYLVGVIFLLVRFMRQLNSLYQLIRQGTWETYKNYRVLKVTEPIAPFSFFNFIVYNPSIHRPAELEMILHHEEIHMQQKHSIDILVCNLLLVFQWFNPLAWAYKKIVVQNLEYIADSGTVKKIPSKKEYQLTLVRASSTRLAPALTNQFYQSFIKKRIIMLNKTHSKKHNVYKATLILPFLALFLYSFNVKEVTEYVQSPATSFEPSIEMMNSVSPAQEKSIQIPEKKAIPAATLDNETSNEMLSVSEKAKTIAPAAMEEVKYLITNTTSEAELQRIKEELKSKYQLDLNYSAVRNDAGVIVSLSMSYSGKSKNGNYQVTDDEGIEDFYFFIKDDGTPGFWSQAREDRRSEQMKQRQEEMEARRAEMEKRREEMNLHQEDRESRQEDMDRRREEMEVRRQEMEARRAEMHEKHKQVIILEDREHGSTSEYVISEMNEKDHAKIPGSNRHSLRINKHTTDAELNSLQNELAKQNIEFNYKGVKRNDHGEITSIRFTTKDAKGSKTSTVIKGDLDDPIDEVVIYQ